MSLIKTNLDPSRKDVRVFGAVLLLFFAVVGVLGIYKPGGLLVAAGVLTGAVVISLAFNRATPLGRQFRGLLLPGLFAAVGGPVVWGGVPGVQVATFAWGVGAVVGLAVIALPALGKAVYVGWVTAGEPIGWTVSYFVLGLVYYGLITPIGLVMRVFGWDPMQRKLDPGAATYWLPRQQVTDVKRYYRQF